MKAVIITGSAGGIGSALVEEYKKAGYYTIGLDINKPLNADANVEVDLFDFVNSNVYQENLKQQLNNAIGDRELNVLVNNAAVQILGSIDKVKLEDFKKTLDVNLTAPFLLSKICFERLKKSKGCIVNIGSIHAKLTKPQFISYATSKAALLGLTQAMAVDFGKYVRVNVIQPAAIETEMLKDGFKNNPGGLEKLKMYHPCEIIGDPLDISRIAIFLSSDTANFVNGTVIGVDGAIGARLHDPS